MQTIKCHHPLNIPVTHFIKNIDVIPKLPENIDSFVTSFNPKLYLHDEIYQKLSELGTLYSLVFSMKPGVDKGSIHIDLDRKTFKPMQPGLNLVLDGQGIMRWFNPDGYGIIKSRPAPVSIFYKAWFKNYGEPIDEWSTGKVALVRVDTPHQAWNFDNEIRRIVTIRWLGNKSWEETIEWFNRNFPDV
jgi:hypothetical protein